MRCGLPGMRYNFSKNALQFPRNVLRDDLSGNPAAEVGASVFAYEDTFGNGLADFDKQAAVRPDDDAFDLFLCDDELFVGTVEAFRIEQSGHFVQRTPVAEPCPVRNADVTVLVGHVYVGHIGSVYRDEPVPVAYQQFLGVFSGNDTCLDHSCHGGVFLNGVPYLLRVYGLDKVVQSIYFERFERILVISGREDYRRRDFYPVEDFER